jgi:hypothetical protein
VQTFANRVQFGHSGLFVVDVTAVALRDVQHGAFPAQQIVELDPVGPAGGEFTDE